MKNIILVVIAFLFLTVAVDIFFEKFAYEKCNQLLEVKYNVDFNPTSETVAMCKDLGVELK